MTDSTEQATAAARATIRPKDATMAADMCPQCKGDNTEGWYLCPSCLLPVAILQMRCDVDNSLEAGANITAVYTDHAAAVLAALDSAQTHARRLEDYREITRHADNAAWEATRAREAELTAERDRLAARVAELETLLGQILARFNTKGHPGYAAVRTAWIRVELVSMWRKVAQGRDADEPDTYTAADSEVATQ